MSKALVLVFLMLVRCGSGGGGGGSSPAAPVAPVTPTPTPATVQEMKAVDNLAALPTCNADNANLVYWVADHFDFYRCVSPTWTRLYAAYNSLGNFVLNSSSTDFCTQNAGEDCYFRGGQVVYYPDTSIFINGNFDYRYSNAGELDTNSSSTPIVLPGSYTSGSLILSRDVDRGSGYRRLFLTFTRPAGGVASFSLYYDTNNSGVFDAGDTFLEAVTATAL